jgi:ribosomal protein L3 glutamine methyltransferase
MSAQTLDSTTLTFEQREDAVRQLHSAIDLIRWSASTLAAAEVYCGHGFADVVDESLHLVLHALSLPPGIPDSLLGGALTRAEREDIVALVAQRVSERKPIAYLTGVAHFAGLEFAVTEDVLVPRSPIAELIESQFVPWVEPENVRRILEIGTGSGCIALACASYFPWAEVVASDISSAALAVANTNRTRHRLTEQVRLVRADVFKTLDEVSDLGQFDLIISNPPYVTQADFDAAPLEYHREPQLGLLAGADGLDIVHKILADAAKHLSDDGVLVVEVGATRANLEAAYSDLPFSWPEFERGGDGVFVVERDALSL